MPDSEMERRHLKEADRHIAETELRIAKQRKLLQKLENLGAAEGDALHLLSLMVDSLKTFQEHRQLILEALQRDGK
jgi:hypothetical protein